MTSIADGAVTSLVSYPHYRAYKRIIRLVTPSAFVPVVFSHSFNTKLFAMENVLISSYRRSRPYILGQVAELVYLKRQ
jgi:hypothetical protein